MGVDPLYGNVQFVKTDEGKSDCIIGNFRGESISEKDPSDKDAVPTFFSLMPTLT